MLDDIDYYERLLDSRDIPGVAICVTVVAGLSVDEALVRFDGFPPRHTATLDDLREVALLSPFPHPRLAKAVPVDGHVILIEDNGYHGAQPETMARLSEGTAATSVYWNVNFTNRLTHARDGAVAGALDWASVEHRWGDGPATLDPWLSGIPFGVPGDPRPKALAFLERASGVRLTREHLLAEHPASVLVPAGLFQPREALGSLLPGVTDLAALVGLPPTRQALRDPRLPTVLRAATELAVDGLLPPDVDATGDALLELARQEYRRGVEEAWDAYDGSEDDDEPTGGGIEDLVAEQDDDSAAPALVRRAYAYAAAAGRLHADPLTALTTVLAIAWQADPDGYPARRERVRAYLSGACRSAG